MKRAVVIQAEAFRIGFDVIAPDPALSRELPTVAAARAYAIEIAAAQSWTVEDRSDEE